MNDQPNRTDGRGDRPSLSQLLFIPRTLAFSAEVFLHTRIGQRYADVQALAVLLLMPLYAAGWPGHDLRPLLLFTGLYVVMCARNRVEGLLRRGRSPEWHSRYTGLPRLMRFFPRHDEQSFKLRVEPALVLAAGGAVAIVNRPLGVYLMLAGVGLFLSVLAIAATERQMALDINDLMIEQRQRAERFRAMGDESF